MGPNPVLGVVYHWIGGLAAASFYIPYRGVRLWSWETYWLVGGLFSWIIAPWLMASLLVPGLWRTLTEAPSAALAWSYAFGMLWGAGGLTFGLTMRYLGIALGMAVALGYTAAFGTIMPPLVNGEMEEILSSASGRLILLGVAMCLAGIAVSGLAGVSKERELSSVAKQTAIREFSFSKGMLVATFSGVMSACFAYGLAAGRPIADAARVRLLELGRADLWQNLPVLVVVLLGGFTTNFIWCVVLHVKNRSGQEYLSGTPQPNADTTRDSGVASRVPLARNYVLSAAAGVTWYLQFFFYSMGQTRMGDYEFSSWTLHMASIIIFSTLWGVALQEWRGTSRKTHALIGGGLAVLVASTIVVGYGNFLKAGVTPPTAAKVLVQTSDASGRRVVQVRTRGVDSRRPRM